MTKQAPQPPVDEKPASAAAQLGSLLNIAAGVLELHDEASQLNVDYRIETMSGLVQDKAAYGSFRLSFGTLSVRLRRGEPPRRKKKTPTVVKR